MHEWVAAGLLLAELELRSAVAGLDGSEGSRLRYAQSRWWMGYWERQAAELLGKHGPPSSCSRSGHKPPMTAPCTGTLLMRCQADNCTRRDIGQSGR